MGIASTATRSRVRRSSRGFTLVELLVVIGIIALLIGILLPTLGKARQAANSAKCKANLHSVGQGLLIYAGSNQGRLPYGFWNGTADVNGTVYTDAGVANVAGGQAGDLAGDWTMKVFSALNSRVGDTWSSQYAALKNGMGSRAMFFCPDAPSQDQSPGAANSHYACHPRLMPDLGYGATHFTDVDGASGLKPYRIAKVQNSQDVALVFDAALTQIAGSTAWGVGGGGGDPVGNGLDGNRVTYGVGTYNSKLTTQYGVATGLNGGQAVDFTTVPGVNTDNPQYGFSGPRFRHSGNTVCNSLMVDGHVTQFSIKYAPAAYSKYTTDLLRKNVNVN